LKIYNKNGATETKTDIFRKNGLFKGMDSRITRCQPGVPETYKYGKS